MSTLSISECDYNNVLKEVMENLCGGFSESDINVSFEFDSKEKSRLFKYSNGDLIPFDSKDFFNSKNDIAVYKYLVLMRVDERKSLPDFYILFNSCVQKRYPIFDDFRIHSDLRIPVRTLEDARFQIESGTISAEFRYQYDSMKSEID